jgi:hypothetical protein
MSTKGRVSKKVEKKVREYFEKINGNNEQGHPKPSDNTAGSNSDSSLSNK